MSPICDDFSSLETRKSWISDDFSLFFGGWTVKMAQNHRGEGLVDRIAMICFQRRSRSGLRAGVILMPRPGQESLLFQDEGIMCGYLSP